MGTKGRPVDGRKNTLSLDAVPGGRIGGVVWSGAEGASERTNRGDYSQVSVRVAL